MNLSGLTPRVSLGYKLRLSQIFFLLGINVFSDNFLIDAHQKEDLGYSSSLRLRTGNFGGLLKNFKKYIKNLQNLTLSVMLHHNNIE